MITDEVNTIIGISGLSNKDFGRLVGCSEMTVDRWVSGQTQPSGYYAQKLRELRRRLLTMDEVEFNLMMEEVAIAEDPLEVYKRAGLMLDGKEVVV